MADENKKEEMEDEGNKGAEVLNEKFDAMLGNLKSLKDSGDATNTKVESLLNEAMEKGKQDVEENVSDEDLQQMTPSEVVALITQSVHTHFGDKMSQLETMIMTMKIGGEIKDCRDDYEDFTTLKDEVEKKAISNPHLSIKDAYKLVKADRGEPVVKKGAKSPEKKDEKKGKGEKDEDVKKTLIKTFFGEKPNITPGATKDKGPGTIREAANKAFEDLDTE